jgi:hypothetical protein
MLEQNEANKSNSNEEPGISDDELAAMMQEYEDGRKTRRCKRMQNGHKRSGHKNKRTHKKKRTYRKKSMNKKNHTHKKKRA